jgi:hypothetical protein
MIQRGRIKRPPQNYGHAEKIQKMSYATQVLCRHNHDEFNYHAIS